MAEPEDESLSEVFWGVARRLRHLTFATVSPFGITPAHSRVLGVLRRHGAMRLSDLSDHLRIAPRSATEVVDALEQRGLAARSPDPADRRATLVTLTAEGERTSSEVHAARAREGEAFFGTLDDADRATLTRILRTLQG